MADQSGSAVNRRLPLRLGCDLSSPHGCVCVWGEKGRKRSSNVEHLCTAPAWSNITHCLAPDFKVFSLSDSADRICLQADSRINTPPGTASRSEILAHRPHHPKPAAASAPLFSGRNQDPGAADVGYVRWCAFMLNLCPRRRKTPSPPFLPISLPFIITIIIVIIII